MGKPAPGGTNEKPKRLASAACERTMLICDGFLTDRKLLQDLHNIDMWKRVPAYNWWDGWWRSAPSNPLEQTIQRIWQDQISEDEVAGFEYWFNALTENRTLDWHRDCDEALRRREGRYVCPVLGNVYYVIVRDVVGGFLELSNLTAIDEVEAGELERIKPVENRLVIFNPSHFHRVSRLVHGKRLALQVSLWPEKPCTFDLGDRVDQDFQPVA